MLVGWHSAPAGRWRVVEVVVACVLGVALGVVYWGWDASWANLVVPPVSALGNGVWLLGGVLGALVVRRPGAAVLAELLAATVEALLGTQWGVATLWYGALEGLGAEVVFALLLYRRWGPVAAVLAGAGAGLVNGLLDVVFYYPTASGAVHTAYVAASVASGAVVAGAGAWALTRALAASGALAPLASGRTAQRV